MLPRRSSLALVLPNRVGRERATTGTLSKEIAELRIDESQGLGVAAAPPLEKAANIGGARGHGFASRSGTETSDF